MLSGAIEAATEALGSVPTVSSILSTPLREATFGEMVEEIAGYSLETISDWALSKGGWRGGKTLGEVGYPGTFNFEVIPYFNHLPRDTYNRDVFQNACTLLYSIGRSLADFAEK